MKIYKSSIIHILFSLITNLIFSILITIVIEWLSSRFLIPFKFNPYIITLLLFVIITIILLPSSFIKIEIIDNEEFRFYKRFKLDSVIKITKNTTIEYKIVASTGTSDISFYIDGNYYDLSPLGRFKFLDFYNYMKEITNSEVIKLN